MAEMPDFKKQEDEHKAWLLVMQEWRKLIPTVDPNWAGSDPLIRAIQAWGELLVDLRVDQSDAVRQIARADALGNYLQVAGS